MPPLLLLSTNSASRRNTILVGPIAHAGQITWLESYKANSVHVRWGTADFRALKRLAKC